MGGSGGGVFQGVGEGAPGRSAERLSTPIWVELLCRLGVGGCQGEWIPSKDRFRKEGWALGVVQGPLEPVPGGSEFSGMSMDPARAWALWPGQGKDRAEPDTTEQLSAAQHVVTALW